MGGRVVELGTGDTTTAIAGAICDCDGDPVTHSSLIALRAAPNSSDTLRAQLDSATFTLRGLRAGAWHLEFRSIGYRTRRIEAEVGPGLDTILVRLSPSPLVWGDCVCRNGREFGRHCCKPMTYHTCPTEEPEEQGEKR